MKVPVKILAIAIFLATVFFAPAILQAKTLQFKVLELDQNQTGPYALFSGGSNHGVALGTEVCVLKQAGKENAFCAKVVSVRKRAAAFYIPSGHQGDVHMGTLVTLEVPDEVSAEDEREPANEVQQEPVKPSRPWFLPGQFVDVAWHLQLTPAIKTASVSFSALPRDVNNEPWRQRDALNMAPLGVRFGYAREFLNDGHFLGVRGFYAKTLTTGYDNDYDLSDSVSHVESSTTAATIGTSFFYGIEKNLNPEFTFRSSAGVGYRRTTATVSSSLKGDGDTTLVNGSVVSSAPVVELSGGAAYKFSGVEWLADLMVGIPLSVTTAATGTFESVQDVSTEDVQANITDSVGAAKGFELSMALGVTHRL